MNKNKINVSIAGMHCRSCEILIEDKLSEIPEIKRTVINYKKGTVEIHYGEQKPNMREIEAAIREAGYTIGINGEKSWFSKNPEDYKDLGIAFLFLVGIYIVLSNFGLTNISIGSASNPSSLSVVFLVGLTAGLSTCMALVGGLILGIAARHAEKHPEATPMQKFRPHLFFNVGRISGYAILGGILGMLGSALQFSSSTLGFLTIAVGIVMLMLGAKLTGIFPKLENGGLTLPTSIAKFFGIKKETKEYSHRSSLITGALTFFLPCGFTQAMQLYAISTGSFTRGAMIMGIFALGTAPGLLGVGGLTSVVKGIFAQRFFKFAGILVVFLAMFNIANGFNLAGLQLPSLGGQSSISSNQQKDPNVTMENGVQVVRMTESSRGYSPNKFTIKKGVPVKWIITANDPYSCAGSIMASSLNIRKTLKAGENVFEFTPKETGRIAFSCGMGMYTGSFNVVDGDGNSSVSTSDNSAAAAPSAAGTCGASAPGAKSTGGCGGSGGGCGGGASGGCGGSGKPVQPTTGTTEQTPQTAGSDSQTQIIKTTYTYSNDIQPNTFKVKVGQPVKLVIDVKVNGSGCMGSIALPGLSDDFYQLQAGKTVEFDFTPSKKGVFNITCAMGVPRGTITVE